MEHDATTDESHHSLPHLSIRSPRQTFTDLRSTLSTEAWKRNMISSDKSDESTKHITSASVAFILCLTVGLSLIVLLTVFLIFRKRHGTKYTLGTFFSNLRPSVTTTPSTGTIFGTRASGHHRTGTISATLVPELGYLSKEMQPSPRHQNRKSTRLEQPSPRPKSALYMGALYRMSGAQQLHLDPYYLHRARLSGISTPTPSVDPDRLSAPRIPYLTPYAHPPTQTHTSTHLSTDLRTTSGNTADANHISTATATEQLKALAANSPCSSYFTASTQSSGPTLLPATTYQPPNQQHTQQHPYGHPPNAPICTTLTNMQKTTSIPSHLSLNPNAYPRSSLSASFSTGARTGCWPIAHDDNSTVDSEDRVVSLPSPSPILRNTLARPEPGPGAGAGVHVGKRQVVRTREVDGDGDLERNEGVDRREREVSVNRGDAGFPILPRSVFAGMIR